LKLRERSGLHPDPSTDESRAYLSISEPSGGPIDAFPIGIGDPCGQSAVRDIAIISIDGPGAATTQAG